MRHYFYMKYKQIHSVIANMIRKTSNPSGNCGYTPLELMIQILNG